MLPAWALTCSEVWLNSRALAAVWRVRLERWLPTSVWARVGLSLCEILDLMEFITSSLPELESESEESWTTPLSSCLSVLVGVGSSAEFVLGVHLFLSRPSAVNIALVSLGSMHFHISSYIRWRRLFCVVGFPHVALSLVSITLGAPWGELILGEVRLAELETSLLRSLPFLLPLRAVFMLASASRDSCPPVSSLLRSRSSQRCGLCDLSISFRLCWSPYFSRGLPGVPEIPSTRSASHPASSVMRLTDRLLTTPPCLCQCSIRQR